MISCLVCGGVRGLRSRDVVVTRVGAAQGTNLFRMQRDDTFLRLMLTRIAALQVAPPPPLSRAILSPRGVHDRQTLSPRLRMVL